MTTAGSSAGSGSDAGRRAVWSLQAAIERAACEAFGAAVVDRPVGLSLPGREVEPLAGLRTAVLAQGVADDRVRYYALRARGEGHSWDDIAQALAAHLGRAVGAALEVGGRWSPAEVAYLHLVEGRALPAHDEDRRPRRAPKASWRCASCGGLVTDRGPFEAAPFNNETGHAPDCSRHAAEIAAYRVGRGEQ